VKIWEKMAQRDDLLIRRPALHAAVLQIKHPITNQPMTFTAPMYPDMRTVLSELRARSAKAGPLNAQGAMVDIDKLL